MNVLPDIRLETERLVLRPPRREDFDAFADALADPASMQFLGGVQPRSTAWRTFAAMVGGWALLGFGMFSVLEKRSGRWVGRVGPIQPEGWPGPEVGWGVTSDVQGTGMAFEAAVASMDFAFDVLGWTEAIHCIEDANLRSVALAQRLGSGPLRLAKLPPPADNTEVRVWGQTREAWRQRRPTLGV
jgi:RimJ/RimL family protein N-acetyltransferase